MFENIQNGGVVRTLADLTATVRGNAVFEDNSAFEVSKRSFFNMLCQYCHYKVEKSAQLKPDLLLLYWRVVACSMHEVKLLLASQVMLWFAIRIQRYILVNHILAMHHI